MPARTSHRPGVQWTPDLWVDDPVPVLRGPDGRPPVGDQIGRLVAPADVVRGPAADSWGTSTQQSTTSSFVTGCRGPQPVDERPALQRE
jgi:hypothetical protein